MSKEQKFYHILQDLFVGAKLEGDSGYVNLMNIKTDYFNKIRKLIDKEIEDKFGSKDNVPEDLYDKLYTFFDSYFSDGGAIFFSSTPVYKNIYAKVYSDREDTALFWKTAKLYYVKSEANYRTVRNLSINSDPEVAFDFDFDASLIKHKQANEKKELEFYFIGTQKRKGKKIVKFRVLYKNDNKYRKLKEILKIKDKAKIIKYLLENIQKLKNSKIILKNSRLDFIKLSDKSPRDKAKAEFIVLDNKDLLGGVTIEPAISGISEIEKYLRLKSIKLSVEEIEKAFKIYKKQTEIDYFIHKDAKGFLREQFNLYMYQHLTDHRETFFRQEALDRLKKIKEIAYLTIDFIGNFEDELKKIWLKPKFARKSNYVLTLDRIAARKEGLKVIAKILKHKGFKNQIIEWRELGIVKKDFNKKEIVKTQKLNKDWQFLPIDTKYFKDLEVEILELFDNLDEELDGRLIKSDNFQALNTLKEKYKEQVQTIYIDPPFNTGDDFAYIDRFQDSTWLTLMENRFELAKDFMKESGSFYLHLDHNSDYYGKLLMDKIFGIENFQSKITWNTGENISGFKSQAKNWIRQSDFIQFYSKNNQQFLFNKVFEPLNKEDKIGWLDFLGSKENLYYEKYNKKGEIEKIDINFKVKPKGTIWNDIYSFQYSEPRITESFSFSSSQKPENLLRRIIQSSSNIGDLVFDFFLGLGTTIAVAHKLGRKWLGVEMGDHFFEKYFCENDKVFKIGLLGRMKIVLSGDKKFKIIDKPDMTRKPHLSKDINWNGGGFFKYYELEQYEDVLKKANYNPSKKELHNIDFNFAGLENGEKAQKKKEAGEIFSLSEKLADKGLEIDLKREKARFVFEKLYPDVDIAETISNVFGEKILKITKNKVVLENREIDLNNLDFEKYEPLKSLIYW